ncbi:hypothetical protein MNBD_GAMMA07-1515 [hydrothermal vent metagenome]|uniref:Transposase DDE domain-containing protein n=1 Tax=hydrothermal vent metagenome TaxID=652676 RepID=A0A3B0X491_9ZZZZ
MQTAKQTRTPVYIQLEKCCCDVCPRIAYCRQTQKQCKAFRGFVRKGRWLDRHIGVDLK